MITSLRIVRSEALGISGYLAKQPSSLCCHSHHHSARIYKGSEQAEEGRVEGKEREERQWKGKEQKKEKEEEKGKRRERGKIGSQEQKKEKEEQ